jgi:hypothetical protein
MDTKTTDTRSTESLYRGWTNGGKYILAQPTTDIEFLENAKAIGTPDELYTWIKVFPHRVGTFFVDVPDEMLAKMRGLRPELQIRGLPDLG